jgi:hypothetical protein
MTLQEAQKKLDRIVSSIDVNLTDDEIEKISIDLDALLQSIPFKPEFNPIIDYISTTQARLADQITEITLAKIRSGNEVFTRAIKEVTKISEKAQQSAQLLSMEKAKLVIPAITKSINGIKSIRNSINDDDYVAAAEKAEELIIILNMIKTEVTPT